MRSAAGYDTNYIWCLNSQGVSGSCSRFKLRLVRRRDDAEGGCVLPGRDLRHRPPAQRHRLLLLPRRGIPQSQGQGHETGRQPVLPAQELRLRTGRRRHRLPHRRAARRHHRGRDHHVRHLQLQDQQVRCHQKWRRVRRTPCPLMGVLRAGRDPAGDRGEHEQRAALRPGLDGRRLLRRQERRVRWRRGARRAHGAPHPRPHRRHQADGGGAHVVRQRRRRLHKYYHSRGRGTGGRAGDPSNDRCRIGQQEDQSVKRSMVRFAVPTAKANPSGASP